jgi:hypothetical protein
VINLAEEQIEREHQAIVEENRVLLMRLGIAHRRPQMIYNELYHPDLVITVDGQRFIPIEVINSNYGFDILGMLSLVMTKDIIDCGVCIVTDKLYNQDQEKFKTICNQITKFQKYSKQVYGNNLIILRENEVKPYFKQKIDKANLWRP